MKDLIRSELLDFAIRERGGIAPPDRPDTRDEDLPTRLERLTAAQDLPREEFLRRFGRHLFGRFAALMPVFVAGEESALDFLTGLEARVHEALRALGPGLQPPRLECTRENRDQLVVVYRSQRHLADLAEGMLLGCADHFGEALEIVRDPLPDGARFTLRRA